MVSILCIPALGVCPFPRTHHVSFCTAPKVSLERCGPLLFLPPHPSLPRGAVNLRHVLLGEVRFHVKTEAPPF